MLAKKVTALLVSAALVLTLLAGCGGGRNQSLSQMLLNLLDGQYQNVSVEIDSDLESKLRQAISESETDEELRAALEQLLGGGISFQRLGSGQQGDSAWTLIIYPSTDPNAAARSVYLDLDKVFAALPADGQYSSGFAMVETENGYAILVKATVDKAGTEDKPDPVTLESIAVTTQPKTTYWVGESFNPANMVITATYSNNTTKTLKDIKQSGDQGVTWTPDGALMTEGTHDITISYGGKTATVTVTVKEPEVKELKVEHTSLTYTAGAYFYPNQIGTVTASYTYGNDKEINISECDLILTLPDNTTSPVDSSYQFKTAGTYTLTVSYSGQEATVKITVNPATVTDIEVTQNPTKMTYISGESFDPACMTITATYSDGTTKPVTSDYTYSTEPLTEDNAVVTISYGGQSTTVEVTILDGNNSYDAKTKTYSIATADGLLAWNETVQSNLSLNCTLTENINMMDKEWTPVGNSFQTYNGTFDGQGYSITGLNAPSLFGGIGESATVKNLQLVDVKLSESGGATAGIVVNNYGTIMACSMTGEISAYSYTSGIANFNLGTIVACWFSGTLKENEGYGIVAFNYGTITACFWDGNTTNGYRSNEGGTVEATKVDDSTVTWQTAIDGMNAALGSNDYEWQLGTDGLPVLQKKQ